MTWPWGPRYIGTPKTPTISIYTLANGEYQLQQFRSDDRLTSMTFPNLTVTAAEIFQASGL